MKFLTTALFIPMLAASAFAAPLASSARSAIPKEVQQVISVDYRALRNSESGMALKNRVLPENLKQFETALKGMGINPDTDVSQLTFAAFRSQKGIRTVGIAQGTYQDQKAFVAKMAKKKIKPERYKRLDDVYPTGTSMVLAFLDPTTFVFGDSAAVHDALDTFRSVRESLNSNSQMTDMLADVESGPVWSILDQPGTQNMMKSALGEASSLADYEVVKKRLLGSRYTVDFAQGVKFDLNVVTSDTMTAATMSSLIKAGMMYKRVNASAAEKTALEGMSVDSSSGNLQIHFKADDRKFQALLNTDLFAAVSK